MIKSTENKRDVIKEDWKSFLAESKETYQSLYEKEPIKYPYSIDDFDFIQTLTYGANSRMILCNLVDESKYYVMKIFKKRRVVELDGVECINSCKKVLESVTPLSCLLVSSLKCAFQDNCYIYFCEPFFPGGDLNSHLKTFRSFCERASAFFTAQAVLALEFLHNLGLVFRDIKPENFIIDGSGYVRLSNFSFCKRIVGRTYSICGSPEYMAPEMILHKGYGMSVDWWSLGVFLFELNAGTTPFQTADRMAMLERMQKAEYDVPMNFSEELKLLVRRLVQIDISRRYGGLKNGVEDIKSHRWFKTTDWEGIFRREVTPPFRPHVRGPGDVAHFGNLDEHPLETSTENQYADYFQDF